MRSPIEAVIRVCQEPLGLTGGQARSERAQLHHLIWCLVDLCVLERERQARGVSLDKLTRYLSFQGRTVVLPALERLRQTA